MASNGQSNLSAKKGRKFYSILSRGYFAASLACCTFAVILRAFFGCSIWCHCWMADQFLRRSPNDTAVFPQDFRRAGLADPFDHHAAACLKAASAFPVIVVFPMSGFINSLLDLALNLVENASGIGEYDLRAIPA